MHEMAKHYLMCALWASTDNCNEQGGNPLDQNYDLDDFAPEALELAEKDCLEFLNNHASLIKEHYEEAGHDFWLTRNHHGAGFWEREELYGKEGSELLTQAAHGYKELNAIVGDDGLIYLEG